MSNYFLDSIRNEMKGSFIMKDEFSQQFVETETAKTLEALKYFISEDNRKKGFHEDDEFMLEVSVQLPYGMTKKFREVWNRNRKLARIALIQSELAEAVEGIRKDAFDDHLPEHRMETVEMADAVIRILDYCGRYDLPIGEATKEKLEYNRGREYKHGKQV